MYHRSLNGNFAYIDNQNMYMATHKGEHPWDIDMRKLRVYLEEKYNVIQAYLFMGAFDLQRQNLYMMLQQCGYILVFREHGIGLKGRKKGNVDVDIVFQMMRDAYESAQMEKVVLLSGGRRLLQDGGTPYRHGQVREASGSIPQERFLAVQEARRWSDCLPRRCLDEKENRQEMQEIEKERVA